MNIAEWSIRNKTITLALAFVFLFGGIASFEKLGRLEDPEFTIKEALIITQYPGATPAEVEEEVTEKLETAIQELGQLKRVKSISRTGVSTITVEIKDKYDKNTLPQVWDELRRKVNDAQSQLPPGVKPSIVYDDYGDVFGILLAITGEGFSYKEIKDIADFIKRELLLVKDVAKIVMWGAQQEQVFVEISRARMAQLGIGLDAVYKTLQNQNLVADAGAVKVGPEYIRINPTGEIDSVGEISNLMIRSGKINKIIYLKDIATVKRGYITPPTKLLRYNGNEAISLGISTVKGGNVVTMGEGIKEKLAELQQQIPLGINIGFIYFQGDSVTQSINSFIVNLAEAVAIVILVLMLFMGLRSALIIGAVLVLTVSGTMIFMNIYGINLQRISLGALIIALGMLVDNAIVVTDGMLVRIERGMERIKAANEVVAQSMWPLFGATVIAILAFAAIGLSQDSTGEYTRSLFQVILISLALSWLIAITITPLFCVMFLKVKASKKDQERDPYGGFIFQIYKTFLKGALRLRWLTVSVVAGLLVLALYGFEFLENSFFPNSTSPQFMAHYWLPEGTDIRKTSADLKKIEKFIQQQKGIKSISTFIGSGAPRYMLVYSPEKDYTSYGMILVTVDDYRKIDKFMPKLANYLIENFPDSNPKLEKIRLGPGGGFNIEARFSGSDATTLRKLSNQAKTIMREDGGAVSIRDDWRERVKLIRPIFSEAQARRAGISRSDLAEALETTFSGKKVGLYRERDDLLPIISRPPKNERLDVENINHIQIWSRGSQRTVPIRQIVSSFATEWEDAVMHRRNKKRTITTQSDQRSGNASVVFARVKPKIDNIKLPIGYQLEWGGEYENSNDAQVGLSKNLPVTFLLMVLITVFLFNALRQPLIIWLTVPLAIIGVTVGLLVTNEPFGFMAILGFLSLSGMLIKNAIVLIDEIDSQIRSGKEKYQGIIDAAISRMRPVAMAAATTVLGMLPLLQDVFFKGMAVTIMSGLLFATLLTLVVVPVFYAILFRIAPQK